ncbi:hypothetical protein MTO96_029861 [Rhipicephalus appendiculatus]
MHGKRRNQGWVGVCVSIDSSRDGTRARRLLMAPRAFNQVLSLDVHLSIQTVDLAEQLADQFAARDVAQLPAAPPPAALPCPPSCHHPGWVAAQLTTIVSSCISTSGHLGLKDMDPSGRRHLCNVPSQAHLMLPPVIVGDDAFPLSPNLMKPLGGIQLSSAQKTSSTTGSRSRRVTENSFGILAHRLRFLLTVHARPERVIAMVQEACFLHNLLQGENAEVPELTATPGQQVFFDLQQAKSRSTALAAAVREKLCDYFSGDGAVSWQDASSGVDVTKLRHPTT